MSPFAIPFTEDGRAGVVFGWLEDCSSQGVCLTISVQSRVWYFSEN